MPRFTTARDTAFCGHWDQQVIHQPGGQQLHLGPPPFMAVTRRLHGVRNHEVAAPYLGWLTTQTAKRPRSLDAPRLIVQAAPLRAQRRVVPMIAALVRQRGW
jgi:hypothetical protein